MRTLYPACPLDDEGRAVTLCHLSVYSLPLPGYLQGSGGRPAGLHVPPSFWW